jgi:hypothetical protein
MSRIAHQAAAPRAAPARSRAAPWSLASLALKLALTVGVLALVAGPVAYILWPRWPDPVALDAPALPITVGGMALNVPPAAIRIALQRRAGAQERIDLVYLWPSLEPPDPTAKPAPTDSPDFADRIFVTIAASDGTPPPADRLKTVYPRYIDGEPTPGPDGLRSQALRKDTPYQNEDLLYDPAAPERFLVRCTRNGGPAPGICLYERRIGNTNITVRFPRDWLADWRAVAGNIDRLIAGLQPPTR